MAKSKSKIKTFKFTSTQSDWLKQFTSRYISIEDADPDDVSGALTTFVEETYKELVAKYELEQDAEKDLIVKVYIYTHRPCYTDFLTFYKALAKWLRSKAKSTRKRNRLHAQLEMTGRRLFHQDHWAEVLKPKVVLRMKKKYPKGPHTSKHPKWLKTMRRVESRAWDALPEAEQEQYEKRAMELNKGDESKQAKARYVIQNCCSERD